MRLRTVILAAGQGTRMRSRLPKVLHPLCGQPMLWYALEAARAVSDLLPVVVVGHAAQTVEDTFAGQAEFVLQAQQLGTGHAVLQAVPVLQGSADLAVIINGDLPLLRGETVQSVVSAHMKNSGPLSLLTVQADDPKGFGRILRAADGSVQAIVEEAQATPEQKLIRELNVGVYCMHVDWMAQALPRLPLSPKGEYYLTDLVEMAISEGHSVASAALQDVSEAFGVNNRIHLAESEAALRQRINRQWMLAGVSMPDPASVYIEAGAAIGMDTIIHANTHIRRGTQIGENCQIGPNTLIEGCRIGDNCTIFASVLEDAEVGNHVEIGPFGHLRKGARLLDGVHMGNFGEVKNSTLGAGVKMGHFSYIGDAQIGVDTNIGAGTITCNYDGKRKHKTVIGSGVFIGSDTMLVAPVTLGDGARTGAGSVVTRNIEAHTLAVGVPARPLRKVEEERE